MKWDSWPDLVRVEQGSAEAQARNGNQAPWAWLLRRVFAVDILECARCGGVTLRTDVCLTDDTDALAFVPHPLPFGEASPAWIASVAAEGLVALSTGSARGPSRVEVIVRAQEVHAALIDSRGELIATGRGDMGHFRSKESGSRKRLRTLPDSRAR